MAEVPIKRVVDPAAGALGGEGALARRVETLRALPRAEEEAA